MTREIIIASLVSAALHGILVFGPGRRHDGTEPITPETDRRDLLPFPLLPLEPELVVVEASDEKAPPPDLAPPSLPDLPMLTKPDIFTQPLQPPPPHDVTISKTMTVVPGVRGPGGLDGLKIFDRSMLDQTPVPKFQARPHYPPEMRRQGISGEVVVDFLLDPHGNVYHAVVLRSSQREFEAAALQAVAKWKFRPGRKDGREVTTHMQVPIVFTLNQE